MSISNNNKCQNLETRKMLANTKIEITAFFLNTKTFISLLLDSIKISKKNLKSINSKRMSSINDNVKEISRNIFH